MENKGTLPGTDEVLVYDPVKAEINARDNAPFSDEYGKGED